METTGQRLKKIRLEKGLSLEEVHKKTKIHPNVLKAIEEDSLVGFNPTYIKGFLKIYCRFLDVNPQDYIVGYAEPKPSVKEAREERLSLLSSGLKSEKKPDVSEKPVSFIKPAAAQHTSAGPLEIPWKPIIAAAVVLISVIVLFNAGKFIASGVSSRAKKAPATAKASKVKAAVPVKPQKIEAVKAEAKGKYPVSGSDIRLGMRAKEDCWVDLKADGRVLFRGILRKGKFESWQAKDRIEFSLGNAGVIEIELNGRNIPALGRKSQSIRALINKKDGLVINR